MASIANLKRRGATDASSFLTNNQLNTAISRMNEIAAKKEEESKNNGGFFGGLGYVLESFGTGFLGVIEGIWDYSAGGIAKLFGADEWAEQQIANDWINYNHANEWYNPSDGWKFAGDVASGIGQSTVGALAVAGAAAIAVASGGTLAPAAAGIIAGTVMGLGAAGRSTKAAYDETGELTGKEFAYGTLSGATEGVLEGMTAGTGALVSKLTKSASKTVGKSVLKSAGKEFMGEAFEEGMSTLIDPYLKRATYDPDAKNATASEIAYSALVGGVSGALMGGFSQIGINIRSAKTGTKIVSDGKVDTVMEMARELSTYQSETNGTSELAQKVQTLVKQYDAIQEKNNTGKPTLKQRMILGELQQANTALVMEQPVLESKAKIVNNVDAFVEKLNAVGQNITAQQLLADQELLTRFAVADTLGHIFVEEQQYQQAALQRGKVLGDRADFRRFQENASIQEKKAMSEMLGVDVETASEMEFRQAVEKWGQEGHAQEYAKAFKQFQELKQVAVDAQKVQPLPTDKSILLEKNAPATSFKLKDNTVIFAVNIDGKYYFSIQGQEGFSKPLTPAEFDKVVKQMDSKVAEKVNEQKTNAEKSNTQETKQSKTEKTSKKAKKTKKTKKSTRSKTDSTRSNAQNTDSKIDLNKTEEQQQSKKSVLTQGEIIEEKIKPTGKKTTVFTENNEKVEVQYEVISLTDIIPSHDTNGSINKNYPAELQPRNRNNESSLARVKEMAKQLNPERLTDSKNIGQGAPIIGRDGVVEDGNGRTMAIAYAMENNLATYQEYAEYIKEHKSEFGITSELPDMPILVRVRLTDVNRNDFARVANQKTIEEYSVADQAKLDAGKLTQKIVRKFVANDNGDINTRANHDFINSFVQEVADTAEYTKLVSAEGYLTADGQKRIENALFFAAYDDVSLLNDMAERVEGSEIKTYSRALRVAALKIIEQTGYIEKGDLYNVKFGEDMRQAARLAVQAQELNKTLSQHISQLSLFDNEISLEAKQIAEIWSQTSRSIVSSTKFLNSILESVDKLGNPRQQTLFGDVDTSKQTLMKNALADFNKYLKENNKNEVKLTLFPIQEQQVAENLQNDTTKTEKVAKTEVETSKKVANDTKTEKIDVKKPTETQNLQQKTIANEYNSIKESNKNALALIKVGDFYEMLYEDAETASKTLDLTLTKRNIDGNQVKMVGLPKHVFEEYVEKLNQAGYDVAYYNNSNEIVTEKATKVQKVKAQVNAKNATTTETEQNSATEKDSTISKMETTETEKPQDFGEKIGGARKDIWQSRGLLVEDLAEMNKAEAEKYVKKDYVWKKPDYVKLVANGGDRNLLWAQNYIRKSVNAKPSYSQYRSETTLEKTQQKYVDTVRKLQTLVENAKTAQDYQNIIQDFFVAEGYVESGAEYSGYKYRATAKLSFDPALSANTFNSVHWIAKNFDNISVWAEKEGFGVSADMKPPRGYTIVQNSEKNNVLRRGSKPADNTFFIVKGYRIVQDGFATYEAALKAAHELVSQRQVGGNSKIKIVPPQLKEIHRQGADYRNNNTLDIAGEDYLKDFKFKGGEFGNWLNTNDRQTSLNYGYDAFKDLADVLGISQDSISFKGNLNIAFGSRGIGSALAHYEPMRKVINLTKMNGAGSLSHEWWHALDDYIGGGTGEFATDGPYRLKNENIKNAVANLVNTMRYTTESQSEIEQRVTKLNEQRNAQVKRTIDALFPGVENGQKQVTAEQKRRFDKLRNELTSYNGLEDNNLSMTRYQDVQTKIEQLSILRKTIFNRVINSDMRKDLLNNIYYRPTQRNTSGKQTRFYETSRQFDNYCQKQGGYWSSATEMSARAFATYLLDKSAATNVHNDYLSAHAEIHFVTKGDDILYGFPVGEERQAINKAFDELFDVLKAENVLDADTRTSKPKQTAKYAISQKENSEPLRAARKTSKQAADTFARRIIKEYDELGESTRAEIRWTIESGRRFGKSEAEITSLAKITAKTGVGIGFANINQDSYVYTNHFGETTIYINPNASRTITRATLHELTHVLKGTEGYETLAGIAKDNMSKAEIKEIESNYKKFYKENGLEFTDDILQEEITAHYLETALEDTDIINKMTINKPNIVNRVVNWLKNRVKMFKHSDKAVTAEAARLERVFRESFDQYSKQKFNKTLSILSMKDIASTTPENVVFALEKDSNNKTLSPDQQAFFADSQVLDKNGNLLVMYHGSKNDFNVFDKSKIGTATGTPVYGDGFYFSEARNDAKGYADNGKLYKCYLNIKNPYKFKVGKEYGLKTQELKSQGYDGVLVDHYNGYIAVAFESNQIKSVNNLHPTENSDIRYALKPQDIKGSEKVETETTEQKSSVSLADAVLGKKRFSELKAKFKGNFGETTETLNVMTVNAQAAVERYGKEIGIADITAKTNYVRGGKYAALSMLDVNGSQYNLAGETRVGDSWGAIWKDIYRRNKLGELYKKNPTKYAEYEKYADYYQNAMTYLYHWHNVDRMAESVNKPVFGEDITSDISRQEINKILEIYPEFEEFGKKVWKFNDNLLQMRVDGGLISQESADYMRKLYPHYVPTFREKTKTGTSPLFGRGNVSVNQTIKSAKGGESNLAPIDESIAKQVIQVVPTARLNSMLMQIQDASITSGKTSDFNLIESSADKLGLDINIDEAEAEAVTLNQTKSANTISYYYNGERVTAETSKNFYRGVDAFAPQAESVTTNPILAGLTKINTFFKKTVTSWNPFFSFWRNPMRDIQEAGLYTKHPLATFAKNYARARKEITSNGAYWQEAKAAGIERSSVYSYEKGLSLKTDNKFKQMLSKVENASNTIEMMPRLAEYISSREAGASIEQALLDAGDVTVNFGRTGTFTKSLNSTIMPFLNPSIQGFSKLVRAFTGKDAAQSWVNLIVRAAMLGIGATMLNDLLNGDDEDYEDLSDYVKESNYVIKLGDGEFLKIPKGRVSSVLGGIYLRGKRSANGESDAWEGFISDALSQVSPVDSATRFIWSPVTDVKNNATWYGGVIENESWDDTAPADRYDETTSTIAISLGKMFNYSPIKIQYLMEQYLGVFADVILPATTPQAETDMITSNFIASSVTQSKWSTQFYNYLEDKTYEKTSGSQSAKGVVKYLNSVNSTVSDLRKKKREIQNDNTLSDEEKTLQVKIVQTTINTALKSAVQNAKNLEAELNKYEITDDNFDSVYQEAVYSIFGAEYALKTYNKQVYEKATMLFDAGIDYDTYYQLYFYTKDLESDETTTKKQKYISIVDSLELTDVQKMILIMSKGYTIAGNEFGNYSAYNAKKLVAQYISKLKISKQDKIALAQQLGLTVQNGKILYK